jgi:hypothetical protein
VEGRGFTCYVEGLPMIGGTAPLKGQYIERGMITETNPWCLSGVFGRTSGGVVRLRRGY